MTVENNQSKYTYNGNGTTGPWNYPRYFIQDADLLVTKTSASGVETTLIITTNYNVTGAGDPAGGFVTTTAVVAVGEKITVSGNVDIVQGDSYPETGLMPAKTVERGLDRLTMIAQQIIEQIGRAPKLRLSTALSTAPSLDDPQDGKVPIFDSASNSYQNGPTATEISGAQGFAEDAEDARDLAQNYAAALTGTSTSNLAIATGSKTFTTQAGKQWALGQRLRAASNDGTKIMDGEVTAYSGTSLTIDVDYIESSGSHDVWNISIVGERGATGSTGATGPAGSNGTNGTNGTNGVDGKNGNRNLIINGDMRVAQRGTSFTSIAHSAFSLDRWSHAKSGAVVGDVTQNSDAPNTSFLYSLRHTVTTADAAIAAGDYCIITQNIEGHNVRRLIGNAFTISFWVRSAVTGVHCIALQNSGQDRSYVAEYTINAANTWEYKTITVSGGLITAGTWDWTTGVGLTVRFTLAAGTTFQGTGGSWQSSTLLATANQVNSIGTIGNIFAIAGVQLEEGSSASAFDRLSFGDQIEACKRYYMQTPIFVVGGGATRSVMFLPVNMRVAPTIAGGGAGFSATNVNTYSCGIEQTTGALQTLTFNSEL